MMAAGTFKSGDAIKNFSLGLFIFLPQLRDMVMALGLVNILLEKCCMPMNYLGKFLQVLLSSIIAFFC